MGFIWGIQPLGGGWLWAMWGLWAAWMALTWGAFAARGTAMFKPLSGIEDWTRYLLIPTLIIISASSLMGQGPLAVGEGQRWYAAKMLTYGLALIIGVMLRLVMHEWQRLFPILEAGPDPVAEAKLTRSIGIARAGAYVYWVLILTTAFFGAVKPF